MDDLRRRIAVAVQDVFLRDGLEGVSMRKVAERVGVTAPAIYRHFKDKDELLDGIIAAGLEMLEDYLAPALEAATPCERLSRLMDRYLDFALEQPRYFDFAFLVPSRNIKRFSEEIQEHNWTTFRLAVDQVALCMKEGIFREGDPMETAIGVWATAHGLVSLHRTGRFGPDDAQFRTIYQGVVGRMLAALRT